MTNINTNSVDTQVSTENYKVTLSESTKEELKALGIDINSVTSEAQAQSLIKAKKSDKKFQNLLEAKIEKTENKSTESETTLISRAKKLAEKLKVTVNSDDSFAEITKNIANAIQRMINNSENNPQSYNQAQKYMKQLTQLNNFYSTTSFSTNQIYTEMNTKAENNKYMLGL